MGNHQGLGLGKEDEERKAERRVSSGWSCNMMEAGLAATKRGSFGPRMDLRKEQKLF